MQFIQFLTATFIGSVLWTIMTFILIHAGYKIYSEGGARRIIVSLLILAIIILVVFFWLRSYKRTKSNSNLPENKAK